jgi:threonine/homoserine/homoserine lactone efflux protein
MTGDLFFTEPTLPKVFVGSFLIGFSGAVTPGPVLARTLSRIPRHGFLAGPIIIIGHMILELGLVLGLAFGLGKILEGPAVQSSIGIVGGAVLLFFAGSMLRNLPKWTLDLTAESDEGGARRRVLVIDGIVTSASNPYWTGWWATVGLVYIGMARPLGFAGLAAFFVGHILSDFVWYAFVSALVAAGRKRIPDSVYRGLIALCALALGFFGVGFIVSAFR